METYWESESNLYKELEKKKKVAYSLQALFSGLTH